MSESQHYGQWAAELDELDELAAVPTEVLADWVTARGRCLWETTFGEPPEWTGEDDLDRELANRMCAACPVRGECLEFELRLGGAQTLGMWGALNADDRRALHKVWSSRRREDIAPLPDGECVVINREDTPDYEVMAAGLDRWQEVPTEILRDVVMRHGLCLWDLWPAQEPDWDSDRELARRLCAGCPVIDQCLELDLRTSGACTTGVWGSLAEDDRRALHPIWRRRRHQHDGPDQDGEPAS